MAPSCLNFSNSILLFAFQLNFPSFKVLVLGNKKDLPDAVDEKELIEKLLVC